MNEQEYRKEPGLNYSSLATFYQSQDHALLPGETKAVFEFGHMFETLLRDMATWSDEFQKKYFICDASGAMPDDLCSWIHAGDDLENKIEYNKDGVTRNGKKKAKHAYIDACLENPGKYPISQSDMDILNKMADNTLKAEIEGCRISDILSESEWQKPVFWERDGMKKKALLDCLWSPDGLHYGIDIKTTANMIQFYSMARKKYWIQHLHYSEGIQESIGDCGGFYFIAASKEKPYLCTPVKIDFKLDSMPTKYEVYDDLCKDYTAWVEMGKPEKGWVDLKTITL